MFYYTLNRLKWQMNMPKMTKNKTAIRQISGILFSETIEKQLIQRKIILIKIIIYKKGFWHRMCNYTNYI